MMDLKVHTDIYMHHQDGLGMEFKQHISYLYYFGVDEHVHSNTSSDMFYNYLPLYSFIQTEKENKSRYKNCKVKTLRRSGCYSEK